MVRKKETIERLSQSARNRRLIHNSFRPSAQIHIDQNAQNFCLFESVLNPVYVEKTKKKRKRKQVKTINDSISGVDSSSEDENAGGYIEPENATANDSRIEKLKQQQDSDDDFSLEIYQGDQRVKIADFNRGKFIPYETKKGDKTEKLKAKIVKKAEVVPKAAPVKKPDVFQVPKLSNAAHQKFAETIMLDKTQREQKELNKTIRVFDGIIRMNKEKEASPSVRNKRISMFNYTPIKREANNVRLSTMPSTSFVFEPAAEFVSTPIERNRKISSIPSNAPRPSTCGLNNYDIFDEEEASVSNVFESINDSNSCHTARDLSPQAPNPTEKREETMGEEEQVEKERTKTPRPADDSLTEVLNDNESWSRKRSKITEEVQQSTLQQVTSAHMSTMCHNSGMHTMMEEGNLDYGTMTVQMEEEKENTEVPQRKRTIQPQEKQLLKESRLSVMTTASSRRESINSLMEDISLDDLDLDSLLGAENRTVANSEGTMSRAQTAMTIHMDDASILPFYLADISIDCDMSPMEQLLHVVGQQVAMKWADFPKGTFTASNVRKLGEGTYGEVFATKYDGNPVAIKIVPIEPDENNPVFNGLCNGGTMPSSSMVLPEVVVMKELTSLNNMDALNSTPNFINLTACHVVRGKYPAGLLKAWDAYAERKESLNDRPSDYSSNEQTFITFVTANGGNDLESYVLTSENEIRSIICQLVLSMSVAERELEFEHRDLHLGNVLIANIDKSEKLSYKFDNNVMTIKSFGVKANIIDFTLSRIKKEATTVFLNLENDDEIFKGQNDPQFDVYRRMRDNNGRNWQPFHSCTNLWWIEYLANRMIEEPICPKKVLTAKRRKELKELFKRLGQFSSCIESLGDKPFFDIFYAGFIEIPD